MNFKETFSDVAIMCDDGCGVPIHGKFFKVNIGNGFSQNYREACKNKIEKLIKKGFVYARRKPYIIMVDKQQDSEIEPADLDVVKVRLHDGTMSKITYEEIRRDYQSL